MVGTGLWQGQRESWEHKKWEIDKEEMTVTLVWPKNTRRTNTDGNQKEANETETRRRGRKVREQIRS